MSRDELYRLPHERVGEFTFDATVADVFSDMISRSVPGYASILSMIQQLAGRYCKANTNIYDLGCSLGAATFLLQSQAPSSCVIHAVDNSEAMVSRLHVSIKDLPESSERPQIEVHQADVVDFSMNNASFAVLNLTLQFISVELRENLLRRIADALIPGGALLISEKVCFDDPTQQELLTELHHDFKRAHGYSDLEIAQKRAAIENRLVPETIDDHSRRLSKVGFDCVVPWFQCFNFVSLLALKSPEN